MALARAAERGAVHLDALDRAHAWMVDTIKALRDERFSSIQEQALANWALIRMQSNVSLASMAIEAACVEVTRRRRLGRGESRESVETLLGARRNLHPLLALALVDDPEKTSELATRVRNRLGPTAYDVVKACQGGAHGEFAGDLATIVRETGSLTGRLRELK